MEVFRASLGTTYSITAPEDQPACAGLTLEKHGELDLGANGVANPGDVILYTFLLTNTCNTVLTNVAVTDPMVSPITCPGGNPIPSLAPGESVHCTATYAITQADIDVGMKHNTATAEGSDPAGNPVSATASHWQDIPRTPMPFACINGQPFVSQNVDTQLGEVTYMPPMSFTVPPIGGPSGIQYNNLGFCPADGLLYAVQLTGAVNPANLGVVQIDRQGEVFPVGSLGLPPDVQFLAGDVSTDCSTMYATVPGQPLYKVDLGFGATVQTPITGSTGHVFDWAYNPEDGRLYGCDSTQGQLAILNPATGVRIDLPVTDPAGHGLPSGVAYGSAWCEAGTLFCYRNNGEIYEIGLAGQTIENIHEGPSAVRSDGASCRQSLLGAAKRMTAPSPRTGLPETVTLDYVFENLSPTEDLFNLSATDDLEVVFGPFGTHWTGPSISSVPAGLANSGFDGIGSGDPQLLAPNVGLLAGGVIKVTVEIEVLDLAQVDADGNFCNQVTALADTVSGLQVGDLSTSGLDPDPDGDGRPDEHDPSCLNLGQVPIACTDDVYMVQNVDAQLVRIEPLNPGFLFDLIGAPAGRELNNLGYRRTDELLYAVELTPLGNNGIVQIDAAGKAFPARQAWGLPTNVRFDAGDVSIDGDYLYVTATNRPLYTVDLNAPLLNTTSIPVTGSLGHVFDWAVRPADGYLYGGDSSHGQLAQLNPLTGWRTDFATGLLPTGVGFGGAWFAGGRLFLYRNNGEIYEIDLAGPTLVSTQTGPGSARNDAAACGD